MKQKEEPEEECQECKVFVGIGMALDLCDKVLDVDCSKLKDDIIKGKIELEDFLAEHELNPITFMDEIKKATPSEHDKEIIDELQNLMKDEHEPD